MRIKKKLSLLKQKVENTILAKLNSSSKKISNKFVKRKYRSFKERKKIVSFSSTNLNKSSLNVSKYLYNVAETYLKPV